MKIVTWNVNGIRSLVKKNMPELEKILQDVSPDFLCLQETRCGKSPASDFAFLETAPAPHSDYFIVNNNCGTKAGYSGTCVLANRKKVKQEDIIGSESHETSEGRVVVVNMKSWNLVTVYVPNSKADLSRLSFRTGKWESLFIDLLLKIKKDTGNPIILCGDMNVCHQDIDIARPKPNVKKPGFTIEERNSFSKLMSDTGMVDVFREIHPNKVEYTWWSPYAKSRERDVGWRLDYFMMCKAFFEKNRATCKCGNMKDVMGSDHAPVLLEIRIRL